MALFPPGKGGGEDIIKGYKGKGVLIHLMADNKGNPLFFRVSGANGDEKEYAIRLMRECKKMGMKPKKLQADKGYDSKRVRMYAENILVCYTDIPYREWDVERKGKYRKPKQDKGNTRYTVERSFAWIYKKYRRFACRWERKASCFIGFISVGISLFWINKVLG